MWGRYCFLAFFSIVDMCLSCEDMVGQSCAMAPRWRIFGDFLRPVFPATRVNHISDLHSKFALGPHQYATAEIRRGKKEARKKERNRTKI